MWSVRASKRSPSTTDKLQRQKLLYKKKNKTKKTKHGWLSLHARQTEMEQDRGDIQQQQKKHERYWNTVNLPQCYVDPSF